MSFSLNRKYIVVNYHYIRNSPDKFKGINFCSIKEFKRQVLFLSSNYKVVSLPEVFNLAKKNIDGKFCAITFDDCLKDLYINAFPILKKYNCIATIFPIASVLEGKMPYVHKIHILISKIGIEKLVDFFNNFLEKYLKYFKKYKILKNKRLHKNVRLDDDILTANFKETIAVVPDKLRNDFIDNIFKQIGLNERILLKNLFMSVKEIKDMSKICAMIGNHSYDHNNMTTLSLEEIKRDVVFSKKVISSILEGKDKINIFSYPHGRYNNKISKILSEYGFEFAVTIKEDSLNKKTNQFSIPRYDTNNIRDYLNSQK